MLLQTGVHGKPLTKILVFLFLLILASCDQSPSTSSATPTPAALKFTILDLGIPQKALNAPIVGQLPSSQILHVGISFKLNQVVLNQLKNHTAKKGAPPSATSIANQLGISDAEYEQIKAFFGIENATLNLSKLHTYLTVDAKVSTFNKLLQTRIVLHKLNGQTFYTPDPAQPPKVPTVIANQIISIIGLDNYSASPVGGLSSSPRQGSFKHNEYIRHQSNTSCDPNPQNLSMNQIASAYGYDQFWQNGFHGEGLTVNLVENDAFNTDDINSYFSCVGFQPDHFQVINVDGAPTEVKGETTLDIDMVAGLAPGASIVDYQVGNTQFQGVNDALQQIINDNANSTNSASVVSISLEAPEGKVSPNDRAAIDSSLQQLTQVEDMTVFIASGDCGAFMDGVYNDLSVSFPASDTWDVAVGGTQLSVDGSGKRSNEVVWSDGSDTSACHNRWGSGGGLSIYYNQPSWQQGNGVSNQYSNGKRELPDISAVGDNIAYYINGGWSYNGGTSAATPIWAAGMVLVNQAMMQKKNGTFFYGPDTFYNAANNTSSLTPYFDVTNGSNLYYNATSGWDDSTGLGTPNLVDFFNVLYNTLP